MPHLFANWLPSPSQHFLVVTFALLVYVLSTRVRREQRAPATAIAWVMGLALIPYVTLPMYLLFGQRKLRPDGSPRPPRSVPVGHWAADLIESLGLAAPSRCAVRMHADGEAARDALLQVIAGAQHRLDICTFIIGNDTFGEDVLARLAQRAREGIKVRVLLDGFGALSLPRKHFDKLRAAGGEVAVFRPFFSLRRIGPRNLRNHRKLTIADDRWLWSGGRNLAAEYFNGEPRQKPWIDLSFTLAGALAAQAQDLFDSHWRYSRGPRVADDNKTQKPPTPASQESPEQATPGYPDQTLTQMVPSGPDQAEDTFYGLLLTLLFRAERRVLAVTPYFVPDDSLLTALCLAARRGVQVELVVPARSNHRLADIARARALRDLVAAGGQVRLAPGMVHAKAVVVDDGVALTGSLNIDSRSLFLNFELMVAFYGSEDIEAVTQWIDGNFHDLPLHQPAPPSLRRDIAEGLVRWLGFQI